MSKILIGNASVVDGTGAPPFPGWVLIEDERIQAVSRMPLNMENARFVNAGGRILAPGFIDAHAHSDLSLIAEPEAEGKISQGITSEISGNCGLSAFPILTPEVRAHLEKLYRCGRRSTPGGQRGLSLRTQHPARQCFRLRSGKRHAGRVA